MIPNGLTRRESQIMTILWNSERPLSAAEVVAIAPELSKNTIQIVLKKLLTLGYVVSCWIYLQQKCINENI